MARCCLNIRPLTRYISSNNINVFRTLNTLNRTRRPIISGYRSAFTNFKRSFATHQITPIDLPPYHLSEAYIQRAQEVLYRQAYEPLKLSEITGDLDLYTCNNHLTITVQFMKSALEKSLENNSHSALNKIFVNYKPPTKLDVLRVLEITRDIGISDELNNHPAIQTALLMAYHSMHLWDETAFTKTLIFLLDLAPRSKMCEYVAKHGLNIAASEGYALSPRSFAALALASSALGKEGHIFLRSALRKSLRFLSAFDTQDTIALIQALHRHRVYNGPLVNVLIKNLEDDIDSITPSGLSNILECLIETNITRPKLIELVKQNFLAKPNIFTVNDRYKILCNLLSLDALSLTEQQQISSYYLADQCDIVPQLLYSATFTTINPKLKLLFKECSELYIIKENISLIDSIRLLIASLALDYVNISTDINESLINSLLNKDHSNNIAMLELYPLINEHYGTNISKKYINDFEPNKDNWISRVTNSTFHTEVQSILDSITELPTPDLFTSELSSNINITEKRQLKHRETIKLGAKSSISPLKNLHFQWKRGMIINSCATDFVISHGNIAILLQGYISDLGFKGRTEVLKSAGYSVIIMSFWKWLSLENPTDRRFWLKNQLYNSVKNK